MAKTKARGRAAVPIRDILRNNVKEKLKRDEVVASMTVRLIRTIEIARIARTAGFDSLYVDIEHSSFSLTLLRRMSRIATAGPPSCLGLGHRPALCFPASAFRRRASTDYP